MPENKGRHLRLKSRHSPQGEMFAY